VSKKQSLLLGVLSLVAIGCGIELRLCHYFDGTAASMISMALLTTIATWFLPLLLRIPSKSDDIQNSSTRHKQPEPNLLPAPLRLQLLLDWYRIQLQQFNWMLRFLCVILLFGVATITGSQSEKYLFSISPHTVQILLPAFLLIIWLSFGYNLNLAIDSRISIVLYINNGIGEHFSPKQAYLPDTTIRSIVNEAGFVDLWFRSFYPRWVAGVPVTWWPRAGIHVTGAFVYGAIISLHHATMLTIPLRAAKAPGSAWWLIYAWAIFLLLLSSHIQFAYSGRNRNNFQDVVAVISIVTTWFLYQLP